MTTDLPLTAAPSAARRDRLARLHMPVVLKPVSDLPSNPVHIFQHRIIAKAQDRQTVCFQSSLPLPVVCVLLRVIVASPINFDDESGASSIKVHDVIEQPVLSPEFDAVDLLATQTTPHQPLGMGHLPTQLPSSTL